jgi:hypothetical protein
LSVKGGAFAVAKFPDIALEGKNAVEDIQK